MHKQIFCFLPWLIISAAMTLPRPSLAISADTQPTAIQLAQTTSKQFNEEDVRQMTVKVSTAKNQGSGTLIGQQGNSYLVLTNAHILNGDTPLQIQTHDGQTHTAQVVPNAFQQGYDIALVKFESSTPYRLAQISTVSLRVEWALITGGYAAELGTFQSGKGELQQIRSQPLQEGYQLGYSGDVPQGMSGGPIFHESGQLVGIQGHSKFPLVDEYINQDGTAITAEEIQQLRQRNWGISIRTVLSQMGQPLLVDYGLPLPEADTGIPRPNWTGWTAELEAKAKGFTVLIENTHENQGGNGSGVIIAKQGNTYTVLTSEHNFDEGDSINARFTLTTHDGQTYDLNKSKFRIESGVDLAVVEFTSETVYPVAALASYPLKTEDKVFVAGFPKVGPDKPQLLMSGGMIYEQEQGRLQSIESNVDSNQQVSEFSQATPSTAFDLGYDLLYTSITYGGMSGGPVLDHQGQVIGIHGLAESENESNFSEQGKVGLQIKLGNSLGIPIQTFMGLASKMQVNLDNRTIQQTTPTALTPQQIDVFRKSLLSVKIPSGNAKPEVLIKRGNQLRRIGLYQQAVEAFDKAIALNRGKEHLAYFGKAQAIGESVSRVMSPEEYKKELEPMEEALKQSVKLAPDYPNAWRSLAILYRTLAQFEVALGNNIQAAINYEQALKSINQAIAKQQADARFFKANLYNEKFLILTKSGRYEEALVAINTALNLSPRASFYSNRGNLYDDLKRYEEAIKDYTRAININPKYVVAYSNRGFLYVNLQRYEEALKDYNQAININPRYATAYFNRGALHEQQQRNEEALKDYNRAINIKPQYREAFFNRGNIYIKQQRYKEAIADYTQAIKIHPQFALAFFSRGGAYSNLQMYKEAIANYTQAIKIHPQFALAFYNRGVTYKALKQYEHAIADYSQAIKLFKSDFELALAYTGRGGAYNALKHYKEAVADHTQAIQINSDATAYYNRGNVYAILKQHEQAIEDYTQAIKFNHKYPFAEYPFAFYNRGNSHRTLKQYEQAIADYSQTIKLKPEFAKAYYSRAVVYANLQRYEEAIKDYTQVIKIDPQEALLYYNRGIAYANLQRYEEAIKDYTQTVKIDPQHAESYGSRGLAYREIGNKAQAKQDLMTAAQLFKQQNNQRFYQLTIQHLQQLKSAQPQY